MFKRFRRFRRFKRLARSYRKRRVPFKVKRYVKRTIRRNIEKKGYTSLISNTAWSGSITSTPKEIQVAVTTQGTGEAGRIGKKIKITKIWLKGVLQMGVANTATDDKYNIVRIGVCSYRTGAGSTPWTTQAIGVSQGLFKDQSQHLEKVYYDKLHVFTSPGRDSTGYLPSQKVVKISIRPKNYVVTHRDDSSTTWDRMIFMSAVSDSGVVPSPGFVSGVLRVWWEDA